MPEFNTNDVQAKYSFYKPTKNLASDVESVGVGEGSLLYRFTVHTVALMYKLIV
jgi:hypothetical protein